MHNRLCGHLSSHCWLCSCGNKISLLSHFCGGVLDVRIVLNSYFNITLKKKDWSFYLYIFLWEGPWSKNSTKSVKQFQTTLFRTSACWRQPSRIWKESLATALLINTDFIMAGLAYVQHSTSENCLQQVVFAAYAHRWQKAALRGTKIGVNFHILFQSLINITTQEDETWSFSQR